MFQRAINHVSNFKHWYVWLPLIPLALLVLGKVAQYFNGGRPLLDDPSAVYGYAIESVPVIIAMILTATYSGFLNNSLTKEQYAAAPWKDKIVDNAPELLIFLAVLLHFHTHA